MIQGRHLFIKTLPSCFLYSQEDTRLLPAWVQVLGLPAECSTTKALSKIASLVGKPIQSDMMTMSKKGPHYARVLVELDAKKPRLREQVVVLPNGGSFPIQFKYEFDPKYCDKCNSTGHKSDMCVVNAPRRRYKSKNTYKGLQSDGKPDPLDSQVTTDATEKLDTNIPAENKEDKQVNPDLDMMPSNIDQQIENQHTLDFNYENTNQLPHYNTYSEEDVYAKAYNNDPDVNTRNLEDMSNFETEEATSCGEWRTVASKKDKRTGIKAGTTTFTTHLGPLFRQPLTRSRSLLLQRSSNEERLTQTTHSFYP